MKTKKFDVYCRVPIFMVMLLEERMREFGFRNKAEIILYMVERYIEWKTSRTCSKAVLKIFSDMPRHVDKIVVKADRATLIFKMEREKYETFTRLIIEDGFDARNYFIMAVITAMIIAPPRFLRELSDEINDCGISPVKKDKMDFTTYVSELQYDFLRQKATSANLTVPGLIRLALGVFFRVSNGEASLPVSVTDTVLEVLDMKGSTVKRFNRERTVHLNVTAEEKDKIFDLILKYRIPGARELTRRLVLFFIKSNNLTDEREDDPGEDDNVFKDINFDHMVRRDYARSIYSLN